MLRYVEGTFEEAGAPTIGASFFTHKILVDNVRVKLQLWDTAGQGMLPGPVVRRTKRAARRGGGAGHPDSPSTTPPTYPRARVLGCDAGGNAWAGLAERFRSMAPMYYRGAAAALLVFDVTSEITLEEAKRWVGELQRNTDAGTLICLVANKADLLKGESTVMQQGREYAESIDALFFTTSAKSGAGINEAFLVIVRQLLQRQQALGGAALSKPATIDVTATLPPAQGKGCCS